MFRSNLNRLCFMLILFLFSSHLYAQGGIALGATRVIYSLGNKQTSLPIQNSSSKQRYLINAWIDDANEVKTKNFIVTPPLFVNEPKTENTLRIMYVGPDLPTDQESLFYLNVKAIPAIDKQDIEGKNVLQLAILSRIKLFVRPQKLDIDVEDAAKLLSFKSSTAGITVHNPSPYYMTLVHLSSGPHKMDSVMVAPKASIDIKTAAKSSDIQFQFINDYGALSEVLIQPIH